MEVIPNTFLADSRIKSIPETDYIQAKIIISTLKAISRMTYQSIYVVDYSRQNFLFVSENSFFLCGYQPQEMVEMGFKFYERVIPENEWRMLLEINHSGFSFFNRIPIEDRLKLSFSFNFHINFRCFLNMTETCSMHD